jgi:hypothetical protein
VSTAVEGFREEGQQNIKQKYSHQQRHHTGQGDVRENLPAILMNILYSRVDRTKKRNVKGIFVSLRRDGSQVAI